MPRRQRAGAASAVTSAPRKSTRPALGTSNPEMRWNSVVLPAPFGPMMARSSPAGTARSTPPTACTAPKARPSPRVSSSGVTRRAPSCAKPPDGAHQPAGQEDHHQDEDGAGEDHPVLGVAREHLLDEEEDHRAEQRPYEGADA